MATLERTLNCVNWMNTTTQQFTYLYAAWAACRFINNFNAPIEVKAVEVWCKDGTSGTYAFANTTNSTTNAVKSTASKPPTSLEWKRYTLSTPLKVDAGATFYAGVKGDNTSTYIYINGYQSSSSSTANAYYNGTNAGGTLNSYPTMGGEATRTLGIRVVYELNGVVYIDNGTSFDAYQVFIDNGTDWEQYIPYIDNGTDWDVCG